MDKLRFKWSTGCWLRSQGSIKDHNRILYRELYYSQVLEEVPDLLGPFREVEAEVKGGGRETLTEPGVHVFIRVHK